MIDKISLHFETKDSWLFIYRGVQGRQRSQVYSACAAILNWEESEKEIIRLPIPNFMTTIERVENGEVRNIVFLT